MPETSKNDKLQNEALDDWAKLSKDELVRGSTIPDVEKRSLVLCQAYIGGSWINAKTTADLTVKRITGGLTNQLYHVHLNESVQRVANSIYSDEPSDVAIKFYQAKHLKDYNEADAERWNDTIILNVMSQTGLGPKIFGIFAEGFIQEFIKHEQFRAKHQEKPELNRQLMKLLARIHHLKVPIRKDTNLLRKAFRSMIEFAYANCRVDELSKELDLKLLKKINLLTEYDELTARIEAMNAPIVFCHNDFRGSNILVTEDETILACDFEHGGYGTRGYDFASLFLEWGKKELIEMSFKLADESILRELMQLYIEECEVLVPGYSAKQGNSIEDHLKEVRLMILANSLFFVAFMMKQTDSFIQTIPFDAKKHMQFVEVILQGYNHFKNQFIENGYF